MKIKTTLSTMLFLQYFIWGCWLVTFASYAMNILHFSGAEVGMLFGTLGIAAIFMPPLAGVIADKWIPANRLYSLFHFIAAGALFCMALVGNVQAMFWIMLLNSLCYMPSLALSNAISYSLLASHGLQASRDFPGIRVFGTVGFIAAMWLISLSGLELSHRQLYIASGASLVLACYAFRLPLVPCQGRGGESDLKRRFGLDALGLFRRPKVAIFLLFSTLLGAILQVTNTFGNPFLHDLAAQPAYADNMVARFPSLLLSVSQISEVVFILTIPFMLKNFGIKKVVMISMVAWIFRFALFAWGDFSTFGVLILLMSMIVYGCAFDFFNISGSIFIEQETPQALRASAQGLFMTLTNGIGAWLGSVISGRVIDFFTVDGVRDWHSFWLVFAGYAGLLVVSFALLYRDSSPRTQAAPLNNVQDATRHNN